MFDSGCLEFGIGNWNPILDVRWSEVNSRSEGSYVVADPVTPSVPCTCNLYMSRCHNEIPTS